MRWTRWNYNGGAFVQVPGGWVEYQGGRLVYQFREIGRSAHAIALYDATRQMTVSLSANKMYLRQPHTGWRFFYNGYPQ